MANYSYKYPLLNDKAWLHKKYVDEGLSTNAIAKLAGAGGGNSARQALIRAGIAVRNISEGLRYNRDEDFICAHDLIEGCLLGDAQLSKYSKASKISCPSFIRRNVHKDHVTFIAKQLSPRTYRDRLGSEIRDMHIGKRLYKDYTVHTYNSLVQPVLAPYFARWYPTSNNYVKVVPKDLKLTPTVLLHWFMDDGSTSFRPRKYKKNARAGNIARRRKSVTLTFCSESFTKADQQRLCKELEDGFGLQARVTPVQWGTGWRIRILESSVNDFLKIIGPCPVKSFKYKWKRSESSPPIRNA